MFNRITNWLQARKEAVDKELFECGYGFACTELLLYNRAPFISNYDRDAFDDGVDKAILDVRKLRGIK